MELVDGPGGVVYDTLPFGDDTDFPAEPLCEHAGCRDPAAPARLNDEAERSNDVVLAGADTVVYDQLHGVWPTQSAAQDPTVGPA